jgi:hypothetical protein
LPDPAQVAFTWWTGILEDLDGAARALAVAPAARSDYQWAVDMLSGKSRATKVIAAVDAPGAALPCHRELDARAWRWFT